MLDSVINHKPAPIVEAARGAGLTEEVLHRRLDKCASLRLSNWEAPQLSPQQRAYAAADAFASLRLLQVQAAAYVRDWVARCYRPLISQQLHNNNRLTALLHQLQLLRSMLMNMMSILPADWAEFSTCVPLYVGVELVARLERFPLLKTLTVRRHQAHSTRRTPFPPSPHPHERSQLIRPTRPGHQYVKIKITLSQLCTRPGLGRNAGCGAARPRGAGGARCL